jgi:CheY-like chemotaxis protein
VGIPPDKHQVIFEAFKQADGSTSRRFGGTGLGLSISRELARLLGGRISLASEEGEGAEFTLCLPLVFDHEGLPEQQQVELSMSALGEGRESLLRSQADSPSAQPDIAARPFEGYRVLLVDDDLRNLLSLTPLLESWGFSVVAAGDASEALETLKEDQDFSLVLMDLQMPERDGYDTIREVREKMQLTALNIIAMGAGEAEDERERCLAAGADDCLADRTDTETLKQRIGQFLEER